MDYLGRVANYYGMTGDIKVHKRIWSDEDIVANCDSTNDS